MIIPPYYRVLFQTSIERSCRFSVGMAEGSAESFASCDLTRFAFWNTVDQPITKTLVRSHEAIMLHVLSDRSPEVSRGEDHHPTQTFRFDREGPDPFGPLIAPSMRNPIVVLQMDSIDSMSKRLHGVEL
ncbi:MAG: hypothetical protein V3T53_05230 [Phycisphaerales bacterium]